VRADEELASVARAEVHVDPECSEGFEIVPADVPSLVSVVVLLVERVERAWGA
jgi:hypothetical protein